MQHVLKSQAKFVGRASHALDPQGTPRHSGVAMGGTDTVGAAMRSHLLLESFWATIAMHNGFDASGNGHLHSTVATPVVCAATPSL